jgi:hypothetical protein
MSFFRGAIPTLLATMLWTARAAATPVVLTFDTPPSPPWKANSCDGSGTVSVSAGVMTIDSPSCFEWSLDDPNGDWHQKVSNAKGWAIETRVRIDPSSAENGTNVVMLWINDHTNMLIVGLTKTRIQLYYPEVAVAPLDTTDAFHVIRVVSKQTKVRIYVDGKLAIDHTLSNPGAGTNSLNFGDGDGGGYSRSYWDYLWYDVDCGPSCDPGSTCADGAPCDDGDPCTENDTCGKGACAGSPVSCPAADECHAPGSCVPMSGCTQPPKPDGTPCSIGVCISGACTNENNESVSSSSSAGSTSGSGGSGGMGGTGGGSTAEYRLYGRAGCYCAMGDDRDCSPAWIIAGLIAARRARGRRR